MATSNNTFWSRNKVDIMQGAGAVSDVLAGFSNSASYKFMAKQELLRGRQVKIQGLDTSNKIRSELLRNISSANATYGARGVSISSGTALRAQSESMGNAQRDINAVKIDSEIEAAQAAQQAREYKRAGRASMAMGLFSAASRFAM